MNPFKKHRLSKYMTVKQLANSIGYSENWIYQIEAGLKKPSIKFFNAFSKSVKINKLILAEEYSKYKGKK